MVESGTLGYIFACLFLLLSLVYYTLYSSIFIARALTYATNKFFLRSNQYFSLGSIAFSPLGCRLMLKDLHYFDSDVGIRVCDMYITFKYWGRSFKDKGWRAPNISEKLNKGTCVRFRKRKDIEFTHGILANDSSSEEKVKVRIARREREDDVEYVRRRSIQVKSSAGRIQVHVNGLEVFAYNNYKAYEMLKSVDASAAQHNLSNASSDTINVIEEDTSKRCLLKKRRISSYEKFMNFIRQVEFDIRTACITLGSNKEQTPYFLHSTFSQCSGSYFLTGGEFLSEDLYRQVAVTQVFSLGVRYVPIEKLFSMEMPELPQKSTFAANKFKKLRSNFLNAANLVISGDHSFSGDIEDNTERERCTSDTVLLDPSDMSSVHITWYKDEPGVYTRCPLKMQLSSLPRVGLLLEVDSKRISYGPFAEVTRRLIIDHFFPASFEPPENQSTALGKRRPHGIFEIRVDFLDDCAITVPFGLKADSPSPPYGIQDSGEIGELDFRIGSGSFLISKCPLLFSSTSQQNVIETYIHVQNVKVYTSMNKSQLLQSQCMNLNLDYHCPREFDAQRVLDASLVLHDSSIWYLADHSRFIQHLLLDISHGKISYHGYNIESSWSYAHFFSDFVPLATQIEVIIEENANIFLNVNENNIIYADNHCDMSENSFLKLSLSDGNFRVASNYHGYSIFRENEQKVHYDARLSHIHAEFLPSKYHSFQSDERVFLKSGSLNLNGYFAIMHSNMSQPLVEYEKRQTQTNSSTGPAKFANILKLSVDFHSIEGTFEPYHIEILNIVQRNYFGEELRYVTPSEYSYFEYKGKNIKSCMPRFLTRNDFRRNDIECIVDVFFHDYQVKHHHIKPNSSDKLLVEAQGKEILYSLRTSVKIDEHMLSASSIEVRLKGADSQSSTSFCLTQGLQVSLTQLLSAYPLQQPYQSTLRIEVGDTSANFQISQLIEIFGNLETWGHHTDSKILSIQKNSISGSRSNRKVDSTLVHLKDSARIRDFKIPQAAILNPYDDPSIISHFREWYIQKAEKAREAKFLCYRLVHASFRHLNIAIPIVDSSLQTVFSFAQGIHIGYTTLHDGNSNSRWSLSIPALHVKVLSRSENTRGELDHNWTEDIALDTALFVRNSESINKSNDPGMSQFTKQRTFMAANHVYHDFSKANDFSYAALQNTAHSLYRSASDGEIPGHLRASSKLGHGRKKVVDGTAVQSKPRTFEASASRDAMNRSWKSVDIQQYSSELYKNLHYTSSTPYMHLDEEKQAHTYNTNAVPQESHQFHISSLVPNNEHRGRNNVSTTCYSINFCKTLTIVGSSKAAESATKIIKVMQESFPSRKEGFCTPAESCIAHDTEQPNSSNNGVEASFKYEKTKVIYAINAPTLYIALRIRDRFPPQFHEYQHKVIASDVHILYSNDELGVSPTSTGKVLSGMASASMIEWQCAEIYENEAGFSQSATKNCHSAKDYDERQVVSIKILSSVLRSRSCGLPRSKTNVRHLIPASFTAKDISGILSQRSFMAIHGLLKVLKEFFELFQRDEKSSAKPQMSYEIRACVRKIGLSFTPASIILPAGRQVCVSTFIINSADLTYRYQEAENFGILISDLDKLHVRLHPESLAAAELSAFFNKAARNSGKQSFGLFIASRIGLCNVKLKSKQGDFVRILAHNFTFASGSKASSLQHHGTISDLKDQSECLLLVEELEMYYAIAEGQVIESEGKHDARTCEILRCMASFLRASCTLSTGKGFASTFEWKTFKLEMPYRKDMMESIIPKFQDFTTTWSSAYDTFAKSDSPTVKTNKSVLLHGDLRDISVKARLANETEVIFSISSLSVAYSMIDEILRTRAYASHITVSTFDSVFVLPNVYYCQKRDVALLAKRNVLIVDHWNAFITNKIFSNCLEMFRRFGIDFIEFLTPLLIRGKQKITHSADRFDMWKLFFVGLDVSVQSAFSALTIKMGEFSFGFLRSLNPYGVRWLCSIPLVRIILNDQIGVTEGCTLDLSSCEADNSSDDDIAHLSRNSVSSSDGHLNNKRKIYSGDQGEVSHKSQFIWLNATTALYGSNFDDEFLEKGSVFDKREKEESVESGIQGLDHESVDTQILHARVDVPAMQTLLRPGALKVLIEFLNEYEAKWTEIETDIQEERKVTRERLKENPLYKGSQISMMQLVHSLITAISGVSNDHLEKEWLLITSIFISKVSFVVAFGDDIYNRAVSKRLRYACGHKISWLHSHACLNEDFLFPLFTAKLYIDNLKLIDSVQLVGTQGSDLFNRVFSVHAKNAYLYIRDESVADGSQMFDSMMYSQNAHELFGTAKGAEYTNASNRLHLPAFAIKGKINAQSLSKESVISISVSGPSIHLNMRLFFYARDIEKEFSPFARFARDQAFKSKNQKSRNTRYILNIAPGHLRVSSCVALPKCYTSPAEGPKSRSPFARSDVLRISKDERQETDQSGGKVVFSVSTPSAQGTLRRMRDAKGKLRYASHIDLLFPNIKVDPAIVILLTEYDYLESRWNDEKSKKNASLISRQKVEKLVHLLSFPHALLTYYLTQDDVRKNQHTFMHTESTESKKASYQSGIHHISIVPFKFIISTEPFSSANAVVSVEESGSFDIIISESADVICTEVICKKVHAEVQSSMEIKSIDVYLPLLFAEISMRENHFSAYFNLSENSREGIDLMYRLTHASQWYLIVELWRAKLHYAHKISYDLCEQKQYTGRLKCTELRSLQLGDDAHKRLELVIDISRIKSSIVIGNTSKFDILFGRSSLNLAFKYPTALSWLKSISHGMAALRLDAILSSIDVCCEGHASGNALCDQAVYCKLTVFDPVEQNISQTVRKARILVPHFHTGLRERQLAEAIQMDLVNLMLIFEDEPLTSGESDYNIYLDCIVSRAYVFLSTALVSMVKSIQDEAQRMIKFQMQTARKVIDSTPFHLWQRTHGSSSEKELEIIPFMGNSLLAIPNGQINVLITEFALTVGEFSHTQSSNVLLLSMESIFIEFAEAKLKDYVQKICSAEVCNWNIARTTADQHSLIIGSEGKNFLLLETFQKIAKENVSFRFDSSFDEPWHGSPQLADFELISRIVKIFSALSAQSSNESEYRDIRSYIALEPSVFAPDLQVTSDTIVNIDTLLNWAGMQQDTLPKHINTLIADLLENLLYVLYYEFCPQTILAKNRSSIEESLTSSKMTKR